MSNNLDWSGLDNILNGNYDSPKTLKELVVSWRLGFEKIKQQHEENLKNPAEPIMIDFQTYLMMLDPEQVKTVVCLLQELNKHA